MYWRGTHYEHLEDFVRQLLNPEARPRKPRETLVIYCIVMCYNADICNTTSAMK